MQAKTQFTPDLVTLTEKILNTKLHFLCSFERKIEQRQRFVEACLGPFRKSMMELFAKNCL